MFMVHRLYGKYYVQRLREGALFLEVRYGRILVKGVGGIISGGSAAPSTPMAKRLYHYTTRICMLLFIVGFSILRYCVYESSTHKRKHQFAVGAYLRKQREKGRNETRGTTAGAARICTSFFCINLEK
jgi:hypothetical protein